jgi:hypothetical protein
MKRTWIYERLVDVKGVGMETKSVDVDGNEVEMDTMEVDIKS